MSDPLSSPTRPAPSEQQRLNYLELLYCHQVPEQGKQKKSQMCNIGKDLDLYLQFIFLGKC